ncbi:MAG: fructose-1,6-bisphosphatase [Eubacterium sp.]|nr:fructose-1,6-bisphosphatase [Eubacterium sp.]
MAATDIRYLRALSKSYPTIRSAACEIVDLNAKLTLPAGTEHFITDLHGEYDQFMHIMRNGSGAIKRKIDDEYGEGASMEEKRSMAALIYYPKEKIAAKKREKIDMDEWYRSNLYHLVRICRTASTKYTRRKVREAIPVRSLRLIEELLSYRMDESNQESYYEKVIDTVISTGLSESLIADLSYLTRRLIVDRLHVIGDIFDRGRYPDRILDELMGHYNVDIEWGNHDIEWMGAAAGSDALIANVIRNSALYGNLSTLEDGYGINLIPLARFAMETYADVPCKGVFRLRTADNDVYDVELDEKMHRAITVLQFKLEGQVIKRHPEYHMDNRLLLDRVDPKAGTVNIDGVNYPMRDMGFPTVDWSDPYRLTEEETELMDRLRDAFLNSEKLQKHVRFLYNRGSLYRICNGNLLYHGCVPFDEKGQFLEVEIEGEKYKGKALYDRIESVIKNGLYSSDTNEKTNSLDMMLFLWESSHSPVFGKNKMATFEHYYIEDASLKKELKNPYYQLLDEVKTAEMILRDFGLDPNTSHIVNGHVPVEAKSGQSPIRCGGKLLIIDGGFSRAYHNKTGIAGYTLIYHSYGMLLAAHEPFEGVEEAVNRGSDIHSHLQVVDRTGNRRTVADTDEGVSLRQEIRGLRELLDAYKKGIIPEKE